MKSQPKALWQSRIFWVAVATAIVELSELLPSHTATVVGSFATILLRLDTRAGAVIWGSPEELDKS